MAAPQRAGSWLKAWLAYAMAGLVLLGIAGAVGAFLVSAEAAAAVWVSAAIAYGLQLAAFAGLVIAREKPHLFVSSWAVGMALRFGAVGGVAWWLSRSAAFPRDAALLSLVGFVFLLVLLEAMFLRWDLRRS